jgi:hypothetical protein
MVRLLLEMKAGLDTVLHEAFQRSETFGHALKDAFEHFINQRANRRARQAACLHAPTCVQMLCQQNLVALASTGAHATFFTSELGRERTWQLQRMPLPAMYALTPD